MDEQIIKQYLGLLLIGSLSTQALFSDKCTFEDGLCEWENVINDKFHWTITQGGTWHDKIRLPTDHTENDGYFIAITNNGSEYAKTANLISPEYSKGHACFGLWYILTTGKGNRIRINVLKTERQGRENVFNLKNIENATWIQTFFNLNLSTAFKIEIAGNLGNGSVGYLAVDDTVVKTGKLCSADCNFESGFCAWEQQGKSEDNFDWRRISGRTSGDNTGPTDDHTSGDGYYIYVPSSVKSDMRKARLSVLLGSGQKCLTFWFYMYGADVEYLHVYVTTTADGEQSIYSVHGDKGKKWIEAQIDIKEGAYQITLEGVIGRSNPGCIAVDDITIRSGVCKLDDPSSWTTALYVILLSVFLPLVLIVSLLVSIAVYWRRRRQQRKDDHIYFEPDEYGMTDSSEQQSSAHDKSTVVKPSTSEQLKCKAQMFIVTGEKYNSTTIQSDVKTSNDNSYEMPQHNAATDSEYTTIDKDNARTCLDGNYEILNKDTVREDEYHKLRF